MCHFITKWLILKSLLCVPFLLQSLLSLPSLPTAGPSPRGVAGAPTLYPSQKRVFTSLDTTVALAGQQLRQDHWLLPAGKELWTSPELLTPVQHPHPSAGENHLRRCTPT